MPKLRLHNFSISLDGHGAGPNEDPDNPLGVGGERLHDWATNTRAWRASHGMEGGETSEDDRFITRAEEGIGATIMGRNMFGGPWMGEDWRGWWGDDPPFHHPVFVLTHHAREPLEMQGGTTFHFVTDGIESALRRAFDAAGGLDVRLGGGPSAVQQYIRAGLLDEMHIAVVPILLGGGKRLFEDLGGAHDRYECTELFSSPSVTHVVLIRR